MRILPFGLLLEETPLGAAVREERLRVVKLLLGAGLTDPPGGERAGRGSRPVDPSAEITVRVEPHRDHSCDPLSRSGNALRAAGTL